MRLKRRSKVRTACRATDRFSLGQPHRYFLRLRKGKVLTDLLEVALVSPPPVRSCDHRVHQLSPTRGGKTTLPGGAKGVWPCREGLHTGRCPFSADSLLGAGLSCPESVVTSAGRSQPGKLLHTDFGRNAAVSPRPSSGFCSSGLLLAGCEIVPSS